MFTRFFTVILLLCLLGTLAAPVPKKSLKQVKLKRGEEAIYYKRAEGDVVVDDADLLKPTAKPPKPSHKPYKRADDDVAQDADLLKPTAKPPKPSHKPYKKRADDDAAQDADLVKPTPKPPKPSHKPY